MNQIDEVLAAKRQEMDDLNRLIPRKVADARERKRRGENVEKIVV